jgi:hypothetical protein
VCYVDPNSEPENFQTWVEAGRAPEYTSIEGRQVPILGLMELLAASRLLEDTDVLGDNSTSAGFVVEYEDAYPVAVRVVKINVGESFSFESANNQFRNCLNLRYRGKNKLADQKDLQFGNTKPRVILWGKLLDQQKQRFLRTLERGYNELNPEKPLLNFIIHRQGNFVKATRHVKLLRQTMETFREEWCGYMKDQMLPEVYGTELATLPAAAMDAPAAPFNPKTVGAACCTFTEAVALSQPKSPNKQPRSRVPALTSHE